MEWIPFNLDEGQALSLEIDIEDSGVAAPNIQITRYDSDGALIADGPFDTLEAGFAEGGGASQMAMMGDDPIWIGFDHVVSTPDVTAEQGDDVQAGSISLFEDTIDIAEFDDLTQAGDPAGSVEAAVVYEAVESLSLADIFSESDRDVPRVLPTPADDSASGRGHASGESGADHGVVVVFGDDGSEELYYIDYII